MTYRHYHWLFLQSIEFRPYIRACIGGDHDGQFTTHNAQCTISNYTSRICGGVRDDSGAVSECSEVRLPERAAAAVDADDAALLRQASMRMQGPRVAP